MTRAERALLAFLVALLAFSPVFFGGVRGFEQEGVGVHPTLLQRFLFAEGPWTSECLLALGAAGAAVLVSEERRAAGEPPAWRLHPAILLPFGGLVALALLQAVPLPRPLLALLSPAAARNLAFLVPRDDRWRPLGISAEGTRSALAGLALGGTVLLGTLLLARRRRAALILLATVAATWTAVSLYGMAESYLGRDEVLGFGKGAWKGVTGTFMLRSPMAAGAGLALPVALTLLFAASRRGMGGQWRAWPAVLVLAVAAAALAVVIPLTTSRMGFLAAVAGLCVLVILAARATRWPWWGRGLLVLLLAAGVGAGAKAALDRVPDLRQRFASGRTEGGYFDIRFPAWRSTVELAARYPVLGIGLGSFETGIHETQAPENPDELIYAHCEPLHVLAEGGILGFGLGVVLVAGAFGSAVRVASEEDPLPRVYSCACGAGLAALLVGSLTDFPLHFPALGISAAVLVALPPGLRAGGTLPAPPDSRRRSVWICLLGFALATAGALLLWGARAAALRGAARRAEQRGDTAVWIEAARFAVDADDGCAAAHRSLSGALLAGEWGLPDSEGRAVSALREADRAVDLEPFNAYGHWDRAKALLAASRVDEAVQAIARARSRAGGIGHLNFSAGRALLVLSLKRPELRPAALDALRYAGTCEPRFFTMACEAVEESGIPAADCYGIVPDRCFSLGAWASARMQSGDYGQAYDALVRLWRIEPTDNVRASLMAAARKAGREEDARRLVTGGP